jgi:DNA polymerase-1
MPTQPGSSDPETRPSAGTLYLVDGYAQFFRAYHAIRTPMTSPVTKEPTNMTFGFIGMLLKLLRGAGKMGGPADYLAVAIDVSGDQETFRSELYPEYKANRPPPPEDLFPQVDRCLALLRAVGVPVIGAPGFEADDAIATLVTRLREQHPGLRVRLVSKDKDLKQLLSDGPGPRADDALASAVEMYDVHTDELITAEGFKAQTGLEPRQVIDMLALMGDSVDNVPGVEGVGPKTSAELIAKYGTLENLIAHADEVKGKRGEALRAAKDRLALSRTLVALRHDAPVELHLEHAGRSAFNLAALLPILKELGFNRYQDEVRELLGHPATAPSPAQGPIPSVDPTAKPDAASTTPDTAPGKPAVAAGPRKTAQKNTPSAGSSAQGGLFDLFASAQGDAPDPGHALALDPSTIGLAGAATRGQYRCVRTAPELNELIAELRGAPLIAVDTETTGLNPRRDHLCGLSFSTRAGTGWYVPVRSPTPAEHLDERTVLSALRPVLEDPRKPKCGHNLKFDMLVLRAAGVELRGLAKPRDTPAGSGTASGNDSMVASYIVDASRSSHGLDSLALALLGHTNISISELIGSGKTQRTFESVPVDLATTYAAEDADVALRLTELLVPQARAMGLEGLLTDLELPLVEVLAELEWNGIEVDGAELERQRERLQGRIDALRGQIDEAAQGSIGRTFNPDSPKQLASALFNKPGDSEPGLGLKIVKRTKTGASTDVEVLETLAQDPAVTTPIPSLIVDYRQLTKLVSTYLVALREAIDPQTGRIHASFHQTVAATGRLASSDPNLQNIPIRTDVGREIRRAFVAPAGRVLVSADYSQVELRILAHLSQDPGLIDAFLQDKDIHTAVAAQINKVRPEEVTKAQRSGAKMVNFGIVYGITAFGLARRLGCGNTEAEEIITAYKKRFAGITTFLQECVEHARRHGYVQTMLGRRRPIPEIESNVPARRAFAERTAINSVVQGSAADLIKLAMVDLHARLSEHAGHHRAGRPPEVPGVRMLLQIHDELVFEAPTEQAEAARALIVERMERAMTLRVPLKADAGVARTWFEED